MSLSRPQLAVIYNPARPGPPLPLAPTHLPTSLDTRTPPPTPLFLATPLATNKINHDHDSIYHRCLDFVSPSVLPVVQYISHDVLFTHMPYTISPNHTFIHLPLIPCYPHLATPALNQIVHYITTSCYYSTHTLTNRDSYPATRQLTIFSR